MTGWPVDLLALASGRWPGSAERLGWRVGPVPVGGIWAHGASLGEARIAVRLARTCGGFATSDTSSGIGLTGLPRPVDHPWALAPLWADARPRLVAFVEGAWWPGLAAVARRAGVPVVSVAARPSRTASLRGRTLGWPDAVFARDDGSAAWFAARGVPVLGVCGSLKVRPPGANPLSWSGPFVVGACTRPGDEQALVAARDAVAPEVPLLLAPRHLARVDAVSRSLSRPFVLRSALDGPVPPGVDVLLDTRGELGDLLVGARAAFIGGTLDARIGGHSPAEALAAGVPVVHGPEIARNRGDFAGQHVASDAADLGRALQDALDAPRPAPLPDGIPALARQLDALPTNPAPESTPRPWARPLVPFQRVGQRARRLREGSRLGVPVIAVGSDNARGAGKSTLARFVADALAARGHRVGVVTRGFGRRARALGDSVQHGPDAAWLGDEGAVLALAGHRVVAHPDRAVGARALDGCTVIVLEDGLQQGSVHADLRLATVDARFPRARGPLPAGEARGVGPVDHRFGIHVADGFPLPDGAIHAEVVPGPWSREPVGSVFAFAGIGRPADFFATLSDLAGCRAFPDHHRYSERDLAVLHGLAGGATLVTTTRDAVRLPPDARRAVCHRGVTLEIPGFPHWILP